MKLNIFFIFFFATVLSFKTNQLVAEIFRRDLTELEELNLATDNMIGPLLRTLVLVRLHSLLCQKMAHHDLVHMEEPDGAFRTLELNNKGIFKSKFC